MLIACQFRFSTKTVALFRMSFIKYFHTATAPSAQPHSFGVCSLLVLAHGHGNWLPRLALLQDIRCQRPAHCWLCNEAMVAREGSAPSTSGCRPDVMLFHHRAVEARPAKLVASPGFAPGPSGSKPGMLRLHHEAVNWWPARVTRPVLRIKSPLHHFNACRPKWCS